jgi:hypothetical protein
VGRLFAPVGGPVSVPLATFAKLAAASLNDPAFDGLGGPNARVALGVSSVMKPELLSPLLAPARAIAPVAGCVPWADPMIGATNVIPPGLGTVNGNAGLG